ncbi:MAG TPA: hypothetical protein VHU82_13580, partial [Vicinamibacterales bacterium]|nr:hypothetical protein [Vicinamibacterales bacterium]
MAKRMSAGMYHTGLKSRPMENGYVERTPASRALGERGRRTMPLGVESNFRFFEPYPLFLDRAAGARVWDADGREYLDFALCFGALMT